jgi:hypothetical protein
MNKNHSVTMTRLSQLLLVLLAGFVFWGCGKDDPKVITPVNPFVFDLQGVKDLKIENTGQDSMRVSITRKSGSTEKISLSLEGLPANVSYRITPNEGLPPFDAWIVINANNSPLGNFSVTLKASGATAGVIPYNINLTTFKEDIECIPALLGKYSTTEDCQGSPVHNYTAEMIQNPIDKKGIIIKNFANVGIDVKATVVCGSKKVVIDEQYIGDYTVSGTGDVIGNKIKISYVLTAKRMSTVYTNHCVATYLKF